MVPLKTQLRKGSKHQEKEQGQSKRRPQTSLKEDREKCKLKVNARQTKLPSPYSTGFRPDLAHLELNEDFTNDFEVTLCSSLCAIGLNISLSYRLGTSDLWNQ